MIDQFLQPLTTTFTPLKNGLYKLNVLSYNILWFVQ